MGEEQVEQGVCPESGFAIGLLRERYSTHVSKRAQSRTLSTESAQSRPADAGTNPFLTYELASLNGSFGSGHDYVPVQPNVRFLKIHSLNLPVRC